MNQDNKVCEAAKSDSSLEGKHCKDYVNLDVKEHMIEGEESGYEGEEEKYETFGDKLGGVRLLDKKETISGEYKMGDLRTDSCELKEVGDEEVVMSRYDIMMKRNIWDQKQ